MIVLFLKKFLRSFWRKGISSAINLLGLCVGMVAIILVLHFVNQELSYDQFLKRSKDIYRVSKWVSLADKETNIALTEGTLSDFLNDEVAGVDGATRIIKVHNELLFNYLDNAFLEKNGFLCDSNFLDVLEFDIIHGNKKTVLDNPNSIVITKRFAKKYFGTFDVINKSVVLTDNGNKVELLVTGMLDNVPKNSSLQFDFLISGSTFPYWKALSETRSPFYTFYRLHPGISNGAILNEIRNFENRINEGRTNKVKYGLQALTEVHFNSGLLFDFSEGSNKDYINMCMLLAIILSIVTIFNFINLFTSYAVEQVKSFAVQKIFGVSNFILTLHFFFLALLYIIFSFLVSLALAESILKLLVSDWIGIDSNLTTNTTIIILILSALAIALLSALYPFVLLSKIKLAESLKGKGQLNTKNRFTFRNIILVSQVSLTLLLLSWSALISRQLNFMQRIDKGYSTSNIISITRHSAVDTQAWKGFNNALKNTTSVNNVSGSLYYLFDKMNADVLRKINGDQVEVKWNRIDYSFIPTLEMDIVVGRNFSETFSTDTSAVVVNETAFSALSDFESGELQLPYPVISRGDTFHIIGVVKDFYYESFSTKIEPIIFYLNNELGRNLYLKLSSSGSINDVSNIWGASGIDTPFEYKVLDESYEKIMATEVSLSNVAYSFSLIAIIITIISLMGFLAYTITKYKHVYAIKRVLGATVRSIFKELITFQFIMIGLAIIITAPIIFYSMDTWLAGFSYKVSKSELDFILACMVVLVLSFIITLILVFKYSKITPSVILREE